MNQFWRVAKIQYFFFVITLKKCTFPKINYLLTKFSVQQQRAIDHHFLWRNLLIICFVFTEEVYHVKVSEIFSLTSAMKCEEEETIEKSSLQLLQGNTFMGKDPAKIELARVLHEWWKGFKRENVCVWFFPNYNRLAFVSPLHNFLTYKVNECIYLILQNLLYEK